MNVEVASNLSRRPSWSALSTNHQTKMSKSKTTVTKSDLLTKDLTHRYGGNGWMMIEDIDAEYCRITMAGPISLGRFQAFLAWKPCLSVSRGPKDFKDPKSPIIDIEISPETFDQVQKLRAELKAGSYRIESTRLVKCG